jgi:hypothetical protein
MRKKRLSQASILAVTLLEGIRSVASGKVGIIAVA